MSPSDQISSGAVLLAVIAIAYGGRFMLKVVAGQAATNDLQKTYFRAGHAHAGVLVILGLVVRLLMDGASVPTWSTALADLVLYAAIVMPAGFFLSAIGRDPARPNRLRYLIAVGGIMLVVGLAGAGMGLIVGAR